MYISSASCCKYLVLGLAAMAGLAFFSGDAWAQRAGPLRFPNTRYRMAPRPFIFKQPDRIPFPNSTFNPNFAFGRRYPAFQQPGGTSTTTAGGAGGAGQVGGGGFGGGGKQAGVGGGGFNVQQPTFGNGFGVFGGSATLDGGTVNVKSSSDNPPPVAAPVTLDAPSQEPAKEMGQEIRQAAYAPEQPVRKRRKATTPITSLL